jgi:adenosylcobinamide-GDP ribazoletransferase
LKHGFGPFADLALCLTFYTRLPLGWTANRGRSFAEAQWAAPLAGAAVGLCGAFIFWLGFTVGAPSLLTAALTLTAILCVTGCLHEDGAADVADGFGGGATRERKLEIMRDSRHGTYGIATLIVTFLIRWSAMAALATPLTALAGLIAAHAVSRALIPAFMIVLPPARSNGLSAGAGTPSWRVAGAALAVAAITLLPALGIVGSLIAAALLAAWFFFLRKLSLRQIGGHTGDVLGALQQGGEIIILVIAAILASEIP